MWSMSISAEIPVVVIVSCRLAGAWSMLDDADAAHQQHNISDDDDANQRIQWTTGSREVSLYIYMVTHRF